MGIIFHILNAIWIFGSPKIFPRNADYQFTEIGGLDETGIYNFGDRIVRTWWYTLFFLGCVAAYVLKTTLINFLIKVFKGKKEV